jgi:hypothetical protein
MRDKKFKKIVTKHAKPAVSFRLKNNETCETACFASKQNFAKQQVCFAKHETCFVLCFAKYEMKLVSLETLVENQSYLGEFDAEFQKALACEAGAQGLLLDKKKSRVENLVTLSL